MHLKGFFLASVQIDGHIGFVVLCPKANLKILSFWEKELDSSINNHIEFLTKIQVNNRSLGSHLSQSQLEYLALALEREVFDEGDVIVRQGTHGTNY